MRKYSRIPKKRIDAAIQTMRDVIDEQRKTSPFAVCESLFGGIRFLDSYNEAMDQRQAAKRLEEKKP